jgi:putative flippase GtrA
MELSSVPARLNNLVRFAYASGIGLFSDLLVFYWLTTLHIPVLITNLTSSIVGFSAVYLIVTRYTFRTKRTASNYSIFLSWYLASIFLYSALILEFVSRFPGTTTFQGKLLTIPVSFGLNYLFNLWLFSSRREQLN